MIRKYIYHLLIKEMRKNIKKTLEKAFRAYSTIA